MQLGVLGVGKLHMRARRGGEKVTTKKALAIPGGGKVHWRGGKLSRCRDVLRKRKGWKRGVKGRKG